MRIFNGSQEQPRSSGFFRLHPASDLSAPLAPLLPLDHARGELVVAAFPPPAVQSDPAEQPPCHPPVLGEPGTNKYPALHGAGRAAASDSIQIHAGPPLSPALRNQALSQRWGAGASYRIPDLSRLISGEQPGLRATHRPVRYGRLLSSRYVDPPMGEEARQREIYPFDLTPHTIGPAPDPGSP